MEPVCIILQFLQPLPAVRVRLAKVRFFQKTGERENKYNSDGAAGPKEGRYMGGSRAVKKQQAQTPA